jgi:hypothetical protein
MNSMWQILPEAQTHDRGNGRRLDQLIRAMFSETKVLLCLHEVQGAFLCHVHIASFSLDSCTAITHIHREGGLGGRGGAL